MSHRFVWTGLDELKRALQQLPRKLTEEGTAIALAEANAASAEAVAAYARGPTGHLKDGMSVKVDNAGPFGVKVTVRNKAAHAWLYDYGSQARHNKLNANRGSMPPAHAFVPKMVRHRKRMYDRQRAVLRAEGLDVSGEP